MWAITSSSVSPRRHPNAKHRSPLAYDDQPNRRSFAGFAGVLATAVTAGIIASKSGKANARAARAERPSRQGLSASRSLGIPHLKRHAVHNSQNQPREAIVVLSVVHNFSNCRGVVMFNSTARPNVINFSVSVPTNNSGRASKACSEIRQRRQTRYRPAGYRRNQSADQPLAHASTRSHRNYRGTRRDPSFHGNWHKRD